MKNEEAQDLLNRYAGNNCTPEEKALVERWYLKESAGQTLPDTQADFSLEKEEIWTGTLQKAGLTQDKYRSGYKVWMASAAALLIFMSVGFYFFRLKQSQPVAISKKIDVIPGGNKAILTLADGSEIILDQVANGRLAKQGNITINKASEGQLVYDASESNINNDNARITYNTISTPRGGQYHVILPDGSKVWLNSASSINFPTAFNGNERNVTITGEAYFEVVTNTSKPFNVKANGTTVKVLGTHFNVMAYTDETLVKTTLLEGSVKVSSGKISNMIKPGEQAQITDENIKIINANLDEAIAWKKGYFYFKDTDIKTVMRQISRWYDVDVQYKGNVPETVFSGKMHKNVNASKVLEILSYFKVNFRIEEPLISSGKKTIVIL